jgi:hypothetical protein
MSLADGYVIVLWSIRHPRLPSIVNRAELDVFLNVKPLILEAE